MGLKEVLSTAKDCGTVVKWALISRTCLLVLQVRNLSKILVLSYQCPEHSDQFHEVYVIL